MGVKLVDKGWYEPKGKQKPHVGSSTHDNCKAVRNTVKQGSKQEASDPKKANERN